MRFLLGEVGSFRAELNERDCLGGLSMSGLSNIGSYYSDQYYQQLLDQAKAEDNATAARTAAAAEAAATTDKASSTTGTVSLQDKIKTSIMTAVREAENSGSSTDLLSVITQAVSKTLKDEDIDPSTAGESDKVDASTKTLLKVLENQAKIESQTTNLLASLASNIDSSNSNLFSMLGNQNSSLTNQNISGYLFDSQQ
jgi:hypothetical protein